MAHKKAQPSKKQSKQSDTVQSSTYVVQGSIFGLDVVKVKKEKHAPARNKKERKPFIKEKVIDTSPWDVAEFQVPKVEGRVRFHDFDIPLTIMRGIADLAFKYCTPIQAAVLEHTLKGGDATGRAQTGTGKTAAFLISLLTRLIKNDKKSGKKASPRALIIGPTRELVIQIAEDCDALSRFAGLNTVAVYGGMDYQKQLDMLIGRQVDIVVATPGRLLDFQRQQAVHLGQVEIFVIDEADRMLDMGFIPDVRHIVYSLPQKKKRQTLLFSATLTPEVNHLASQWTDDPEIVEIEPEKVTVEAIQEIIYLITVEQKYALLYNLITKQKLERVIIFCNRRDETRKLTDVLRFFKISCDQLSGDVAQKKRMDTLEKFKSGKIQILVATDVAGRGIHVEEVSHVINFTLPYDAEDYVHRIGRTGRAGKSGISISFASEEDSFYIPDIEEYIGHKLHCEYPEEEWVKLPDTIDLSKLKSTPRRKQGYKKPNSRRKR